MSYIESNLGKDERVKYFAEVHWIIFVLPIMGLIFSLFIFTFVSVTENEREVPNLMILIISLIYLIKALVYKMTTELAITNKQVISKHGLIQRDTMELKLNKVESLTVSQGIIERIVGAGTIIVTGTGGGKNKIKSISNPLVFKKKVLDLIED
ncbi:MAG: PH domain-containing protein [Campylobacterota bacterium]|nr:PH domain-containing protein [Campylobacterota bacterium]